MTDGGFRLDGRFVPLAWHDVVVLTEAFRRAVLQLFVRRGLLGPEARPVTPGRLSWPKPHKSFTHPASTTPAAASTNVWEPIQ